MKPVIGRHFQGAATLTAQPSNGGPAGPVEGMAVTYNQVGYFYGQAVAIAAGAAAASLARRRESQRDILMLAAHDEARVLGRLSNGTLEFTDSPEGLLYEGELNLDDPEGRAAYEKVKRGDYNAASIGFSILAGKDTAMADNSPEAAGDELIPVFLATEIDLYEVSLLAQGAFGGATSRLARLRAQLPAGYAIVAADEHGEPAFRGTSAANANEGAAAEVGGEDGTPEEVEGESDGGQGEPESVAPLPGRTVGEASAMMKSRNII